MKKSIAKNLSYNIVYTIALYVLPLLTVPYISRVLGAEQIGVYNYTYSIVQYFVIFGTLGLDIYGNRQIAYSSGNPIKINKDFWSIFTIRLITTSLALLIFLGAFCRKGEYYKLYLLQSIYIVSAMIDITWFFKGQEDFKTTVIRNLIVRLIGVALTFALVKKTNNIDLYILINAGVMLLGNICLWPLLQGKVKFVKIQYSDVLAHFIPILALFIPQIAGQIYTVLDKFMLGELSTMIQVGYYSQTQKIQRAVLALVTTLGTVMLPRMSAIYASGDEEKLNKYLNQSFCGVALVTLPMSVGLAVVSGDFVPLFLGNEFANAVPTMMILSSVILAIALSNVSGVQYLLPSNRTKQFTGSVVAGALTNVLFNTLLIPRYGASGAAVATLIAETVVLLVQVSFIRRAIDFKKLAASIGKSLGSCALMVVAITLVNIFLTNTGPWPRIACKVIVGIVVYSMALLVQKERLFLTMIDQSNKRFFKK